jgi:hypothetical protein
MSALPPRTLSGTLDRTGVEAVLRDLAAAGSSGTLRIGRSSPVWLLLVHGQLALAGRRGGATLRAAASAALDPGAVAELPEQGGEPGFAAALVERFGDSALPVIRDHVVANVFGAMLPSEEPYVFGELAAPPLPERLRFDVEGVLVDARQRVERWRRVAESIPSVETVFRPRRRLAPEITSVDLTPDEWTVLVVLDGRRSVAQTISAVGRSAYDVCSLLHELLSRGLIERVT